MYSTVLVILVSLMALATLSAILAPCMNASKMRCMNITSMTLFSIAALFFCFVANTIPIPEPEFSTNELSRDVTVPVDLDSQREEAFYRLYKGMGGDRSAGSFFRILGEGDHRKRWEVILPISVFVALSSFGVAQFFSIKIKLRMED